MEPSTKYPATCIFSYGGEFVRSSEAYTSKRLLSFVLILVWYIKGMVNNFIQYILWDGKVLFNLNGIFYVTCCLTDIKRRNVVSVISFPFNILCGKQSVDWSDKKVKGITRFEGSPTGGGGVHVAQVSCLVLRLRFQLFCVS